MAKPHFKCDGAALLVLVTFGLVVFWPVFAAEWVLVDDHEILALLPPIGADAGMHPPLDFLGMGLISDPSVGRFRPLYWTIRFGEVALLGDHPHAWHMLVFALGLIASALLYGTARVLGASSLHSVLLAGWLLVAPGVSSVWIRLGVDDTVATVFLTLSLFAAAHAIARPRSGWDVVLVLAAAASVLSKESFALAALAVGAFRITIPLVVAGQRPRFRKISIGGLVVLCLGISGTINAALIGASAGPLSYGGRYMALPDAGDYVRSFAHNAAILAFVGLLWMPPLFIWRLRSTRMSTTEFRLALLATGLAMVLVVPQLLLYSQQGVFEGKYQTAGAIGVAAWSMTSLIWVERAGLARLHAGIALWCAALLAFGFSTWTYAGYFTQDSVQLKRLVGTLAATAGPSQTVGIAAEPAGHYEPIQSFIDHFAHQGRRDLRLRVLPLPPDEPYSPLEASFAAEFARSNLAQPPLADTQCLDLAAMIVLGDELQTRAAMPCLDRFKRVEFTSVVLLWGAEGVSLRPRLPGDALASYVVLLPAGS